MYQQLSMQVSTVLHCWAPLARAMHVPSIRVGPTDAPFLSYTLIHSHRQQPAQEVHSLLMSKTVPRMPRSSSTWT